MNAREWLRSRAGKTRSYAAKVNAPLTTATVEALRDELVGGDYARYRRPPSDEPLEATGVALMPPDALRMVGGRVVSCVCHVVYSECRCGRRAGIGG